MALLVLLVLVTGRAGAPSAPIDAGPGPAVQNGSDASARSQGGDARRRATEPGTLAVGRDPDGGTRREGSAGLVPGQWTVRVVEAATGVAVPRVEIRGRAGDGTRQLVLGASGDDGRQVVPAAELRAIGPRLRLWAVTVGGSGPEVVIDTRAEPRTVELELPPTGEIRLSLDLGDTQGAVVDTATLWRNAELFAVDLGADSGGRLPAMAGDGAGTGTRAAADSERTQGTATPGRGDPSRLGPDRAGGDAALLDAASLDDSAWRPVPVVVEREVAKVARVAVGSRLALRMVSGTERGHVIVDGPRFAGDIVFAALSFDADASVACGRVLGRDGRPLAGERLHVFWTWSDRDSSGGGGQSAALLETDRDGRFATHLPHEAIGARLVARIVRAEDPGQATLVAHASVRPGVSDLGDLVLRAVPRLVHGRLVTPYGDAPDAGWPTLHVEEWRADAGRWRVLAGSDRRVDDDGSFEIRGPVFADARLRLVVGPGPHRPVAPIEFGIGDRCEIELRAGFDVQLIVRAPGGVRPRRDLDCRLEPMASDSPWPAAHWVGDDEVVWRERLEPGASYRLVVRCKGIRRPIVPARVVEIPAVAERARAAGLEHVVDLRGLVAWREVALVDRSAVSAWLLVGEIDDPLRGRADASPVAWVAVPFVGGRARYLAAGPVDLVVAARGWRTVVARAVIASRLRLGLEQPLSVVLRVPDGVEDLQITPVACPLPDALVVAHGERRLPYPTLHAFAGLGPRELVVDRRNARFETRMPARYTVSARWGSASARDRLTLATLDLGDASMRPSHATSGEVGGPEPIVVPEPGPGGESVTLELRLPATERAARPGR